MFVCDSALVAMLRDSVSSGAAGSPYQELLMKCIWKVVRLLPEWLSQLEFHEIMLEIHKFLEVNAGWADWRECVRCAGGRVRRGGGAQLGLKRCRSARW